MGYKYAKNFLDPLCIVSTCVIQKCVAIALGICAKMVGKFLPWLAYDSMAKYTETYVRNAKGMLLESHAMT